jgi:uncharacterized protein (TIGR03435 family)
MRFRTVIVSACAIIASYTALPGQPTAPLSFEVASVKKVDHGERLTLSPVRNGGSVHWVTGRPQLILYAYHSQRWCITGLQAENSWYQIDAKTDPSATEDQIRLMLQTLLVERFKFASHRESREVNGYALTVAKGETKLKPVSDGEKASPMPAYWDYQKPFAEQWEGRVVVTSEGIGKLALTARRVTMHEVAEAMQDTLRTFVEDATGLSGKYYLGIEFANPNEDSEMGSLADALRMEVGLRLEKRKAQTEFFTIDHIEEFPVGN